MATVYFDLDGTLCRYDRPFERIFALACDRTGARSVEAAYRTYTERFFEAFEALTPAPYEAGARAAVDRHDLGVAPADLAAAVRAVERESVSAPEGAREALERLAADHRLGVLSNGLGDLQRAKLDACGLSDRFEAVLVSHEVGALKPDPAAFAEAERRLPGDRYVYVGDDVETDLEPAADRGFDTVHVAPAAEGSPPSAVDHRVAPAEFGRVADLV